MTRRFVCICFGCGFCPPWPGKVLEWRWPRPSKAWSTRRPANCPTGDSACPKGFPDCLLEKSMLKEITFTCHFGSWQLDLRQVCACSGQAEKPVWHPSQEPGVPSILSEPKWACLNVQVGGTRRWALLGLNHHARRKNGQAVRAEARVEAKSIPHALQIKGESTHVNYLTRVSHAASLLRQ